jgi:hypothetical protein
VNGPGAAASTAEHPQGRATFVYPTRGSKPMMNDWPEAGNTPSPSGEHDLAVAVAAGLLNRAHRDVREARQLLFQALRARAARGGRQPGQHGTPAGYRRHQRHATVPCEACMEAWTWSKRAAREAGAVA